MCSVMHGGFLSKMRSENQNNPKMTFNKTETEYNMKSIRFLLLTITAMFISIAGLMIVIGLSVYSNYHSFDYFYESAKSGRFFTPSVLSVLLGLVLLVLTSFGFFGSLKKSTCMVNLYALFLTLMVLAKLVVVILAFTIDRNRIINYMDVPVWEYAKDPEIQAEIDRLQISLNCCGGDSFLDYVGVELTANHSTAIVTKEIDGSSVTTVVPESCCITTDNEWCTRVRPVGCKAALVELIVQNSSVLGVLGVSVMFIELLGIVFALLLARCIRKSKSEKALLTWKIKEQMILARQDKENHVYIDKPDSSAA